MNKNIILLLALAGGAYFFLRKKETETPETETFDPGITPPGIDNPYMSYGGLEGGGSFMIQPSTIPASSIYTYNPVPAGSAPPPQEVIDKFWVDYNAWKLNINNTYPFNPFENFLGSEGQRKTRLGTIVNIPMPTSFKVPFGVTYVWDRRNYIWRPMFDTNVYGGI